MPQIRPDGDQSLIFYHHVGSRSFRPDGSPGFRTLSLTVKTMGSLCTFVPLASDCGTSLLSSRRPSHFPSSCAQPFSFPPSLLTYKTSYEKGNKTARHVIHCSKCFVWREMASILSSQARLRSVTPAASPASLLPLLLGPGTGHTALPDAPPATHPLPCCLRWKLPCYPRDPHTPSSRFSAANGMLCCHFSAYLLVSLWGSLRGGTVSYPSCPFRRLVCREFSINLGCMND